MRYAGSNECQLVAVAETQSVENCVVMYHSW